MTKNYFPEGGQVINEMNPAFQVTGRNKQKLIMIFSMLFVHFLL